MNTAASLAPSVIDWPLLLQYAVIVLAAAAASAWWLLRSLAPALERRLRIAVALPLLRNGRPQWMRALGRRIAPSPQSATGCGGCDSRCDSAQTETSASHRTAAPRMR
jgi:hypothetical protein